MSFKYYNNIHYLVSVHKGIIFNFVRGWWRRNPHGLTKYVNWFNSSRPHHKELRLTNLVLNNEKMIETTSLLYQEPILSCQWRRVSPEIGCFYRHCQDRYTNLTRTHNFRTKINGFINWTTNIFEAILLTFTIASLTHGFSPTSLTYQQNDVRDIRWLTHYAVLQSTLTVITKQSTYLITTSLSPSTDQPWFTLLHVQLLQSIFTFTFFLYRNTRTFTIAIV